MQNFYYPSPNAGQFAIAKTAYNNYKENRYLL